MWLLIYSEDLCYNLAWWKTNLSRPAYV